MGVRTLRSAVVTGALFAALLCIATGAGVASANPGADNISTAMTQNLPITQLTGSLDSTTTDARDVYKIYLKSGQTLDASITVTSAETIDTNFDIMLYLPPTKSIDETRTTPAMWSNGPLYEHFTFMAADSGWYYLDVHAWKGGGDYTLDAKVLSQPISFRIGSLWVSAKSAKKGKSVHVSAVVSPAYNGWYSPVYFHFYRWERGKYRQKAEKVGGGRRNPGEAQSKLTASYKFPTKGKWAVRAEFWDEAHPAGKMTPYKYITIK